MTDCVFCRRIELGGYDRTAVGGVVCFEPLNPVTPGHLLFVPRAHVADAGERPWVTADTMLAAAEMAPRRCGSYNLITSAGLPATQSVRHLHIHLVPRREGDGLNLPWTGQRKAEGRA